MPTSTRVSRQRSRSDSEGVSRFHPISGTLQGRTSLLAVAYDFAAERFKRTPMPDAQFASESGGDSVSGVAAPSLSYQRMQQWWDTIDAVRGGTCKLRELGETYLPKEPQETDEAYSRRIARAVFTPWYVRLVRGLVGMVLRKPIAIEYPSNQVKAIFEEHLEDINLDGDNLETFAREVFESAIDCNYAGILIDYPDASGIRTRADEVAAGLRPYWVHYPARDILGVKWVQAGSQRLITQVRLKQCVAEDDGEFGDREVEQILVYDLAPTDDGPRCRWRIFRQEEQKGKDKEKIEWVLWDGGMMSLSVVPFALVYTDKKKRLCLEPPMLEIAHLNLRHFQVSADLDHALHIAAIPRLFLFGASPEDVGEIGSVDEAVCIPNPEARAEWSSPRIEAFQSLSDRLDKLEHQMAALGLSTLTSQKNVGESAEAKRLDRTQGDSVMAVIAQSLQSALNQVLRFHAMYLGVDAPTCTVNRDFDLSQMDSQMLSALTAVVNAGKLSTETFLHLLQRGEIGLPDDWSPEEELGKLQAEFQKQTAPVLPSIEDEL